MSSERKTHTFQNIMYKTVHAGNFVSAAGVLLDNRLDLIKSPSFHSPVENFVAQHTGDWINGWFNVWIFEKLLGKFAPSLSSATRTIISATLASALIIFAETVNLPEHLFGYADPVDLPIGLLSVGVAVAAGVGRINFPVVDELKKEFITPIIKSIRRQGKRV